jgi:hypothetical protein
MILIRIALICLIIYLILRSFVKYNEVQKSEPGKADGNSSQKGPVRKISKKVGEYIDYEEIKKK